MQPYAVHGRPLLPDARVFPRRAVTRARDVAQDAIKVDRPADLVEYVRHDARVEVRDHERGRREARELVHEQLRALVVAVVGNDEPCRRGRADREVVGVQGLQELCGLGSMRV